MSRQEDNIRAVTPAQFREAMARRGGGGDPGGDGPDLFRAFREKALDWRNRAKRLLRPSLPLGSDPTITPELQTFNRIAAGGVLGTVTAICVLVDHKMQEPRRDI